MPPLMLDRDEALAVAVCLRSTASESIAGGGEAAVRALAKLEQLLPSPLRHQVGAIGTITARLGGGATSPVDPEVLVTLNPGVPRRRAAARPTTATSGRETERRLDPHRLVIDGAAMVPRRPRRRPGRLAHAAASTGLLERGPAPATA